MWIGQLSTLFSRHKILKTDGFWIFKKPKKPIYISGYAGSMKNVNLRLLEATQTIYNQVIILIGS